MALPGQPIDDLVTAAVVRNRADPATEPPDAAAPGSGPETHQLDGLLHLLAPHQREVLVLRIAVGLSSEEAAVATGSTPDAVRVTQHRALTRLRRHVRAGAADAAAPAPHAAVSRPDHARIPA